MSDPPATGEPRAEAGDGPSAAGQDDSPAAVVRRFWDALQDRDWDAVASLLADRATLYLPASKELFVGPHNIVAINREYQEGWSIRVRGITADGERVVSDVEVPMEDGPIYRVAAFATVRDGLIAAMEEYWIVVGAEAPPAWRRQYASGHPAMGW